MALAQQRPLFSCDAGAKPPFSTNAKRPTDVGSTRESGGETAPSSFPCTVRHGRTPTAVEEGRKMLVHIAPVVQTR